MQKEKRRPTLEELKELPAEVRRMEVRQALLDAPKEAIIGDIPEKYVALLECADADLTAESVVAFRDSLKVQQVAQSDVQPAVQPVIEKAEAAA